MLYVAGENMLPILVALLIGFITGLWIWKFARKVVIRSDPTPGEEAPLRRPYVDNRPPPAPLRVPVSGRERSPVAVPRAEPEVLARRGIAAGQDGVASGAAAAIEDVADQFMDIDSHPGAVGSTSAEGDDLQAMKGVGPKLASLLRAEGITRYEQIAGLTPDDLVRLDAHLGAFKGRLARDRIVEQAAFLAARDRKGYEQAFGRL